MSTIADYYTQAELALAAYADLAPGISDKNYTDALVNAGMSAAQAEDFAANWQVIDQYNGLVEKLVYNQGR